MSSKNFKRVLVILMCVCLLMTALSGCFGSTSGDSGTADGTASGDGAETGSSGGGFSAWIPMIGYLLIIILVFYFLMIRPEKKRKKKAQEMRDALAVGDNVVTIGGIVGKIVNVSGDYITFETGEDRVRIKIAKWGISSTGKDTEEPVEKAGE